MFYFVCLLHWITNENYYYSLSNMFELILHVCINRDVPGNATAESDQSKRGGAGIDVEKSCSVESDKFIYLTPNEKKRLRQKRYRLRKASSDDFKRCEQDRINVYLIIITQIAPFCLFFDSVTRHFCIG